MELFDRQFYLFMSCRMGCLSMVSWLHRRQPLNHTQQKDLFILACTYHRIRIAQWVYSISLAEHRPIPITIDHGVLLRNAIRDKDQPLGSWLLTLSPHWPIRFNQDDVFRLACSSNQLDMVKSLIAYDPSIHIHVLNDTAFRNACLQDHLELAQYLWSLNSEYSFVDVHAEQNQVFRCLGMFPYPTVSFRMIEWVFSLCDHPFLSVNIDSFYHVYHDLESTFYEKICELGFFHCTNRFCVSCTAEKVHSFIRNHEFEVPMSMLGIVTSIPWSPTMEFCLICYEVNPDCCIQLKCSHVFCLDHLFKWVCDKPLRCPYCRTTFQWNQAKRIQVDKQSTV